MKGYWILSVITLGIVLFSVTAYAQSYAIPNWVKNNASWWADDLISDNDFVGGIKYLMGEGLLSTNPIPDEFPSHLKADARDWANGKISDNEYLLILEVWISNSKSEPTFDDKPIPVQRNESSTKLPEWIRNVFVWYADGKVSENELLNSIKYLVQEKIIVVDTDSTVQGLTCKALYDEAVNRIISNSVFDRIASGILVLEILYPELLTDKQLAEAVWSESGRTLIANQERIYDIADEMDSKQCSLTYEQDSMIKFLQGWLKYDK